MLHFDKFPAIPLISWVLKEKKDSIRDVDSFCLCWQHQRFICQCNNWSFYIYNSQCASIYLGLPFICDFKVVMDLIRLTFRRSADYHQILVCRSDRRSFRLISNHVPNPQKPFLLSNSQYVLGNSLFKSSTLRLAFV